ncbi:hypothetical protein MPSEU_000900600 [Mayamaea pseudoterrestris]|nr:hypothetical protein MPSEU_000900600 [Mayamaea pseudoterrestris]
MMPPREDTPLMNGFSFGGDGDGDDSSHFVAQRRPVVIVVALLFTVVTLTAIYGRDRLFWNGFLKQAPTGPYMLIERQVGDHFLSHYNFYEGADTLGSAGYNHYVAQRRAQELELVQVNKTTDEVIMKSAPTAEGPRESLRLEGKRRFKRGLFILDVTHIPAGCGVWPAFWLSDDDNGQWPIHGEIDIVEGVNTLSTAKTALHTSESCSMYAHVPTWTHTGVWDRASGIPDTWTGVLDDNTSVPADNCWSMAAHQWGNQGCVVAESRNDTIGEGFNRNGGGVYALEWDPAYRYIKSWVWAQDEIPANLKDAMTTSVINEPERVEPDPTTWNTPYAYFAIGKDTGCSADHFLNHRVIFNLAFCGNVAGNRFLMDCPALSTDDENDPIAACNEYIRSNPKDLEEAYWSIRGVYVYERTMQAVR